MKSYDEPGAPLLPRKPFSGETVGAALLVAVG